MTSPLTHGKVTHGLDLIEPDDSLPGAHLLAPPVGIATTSEGLDGATSWELARLQVAVNRGAPFADSVFNSWRETQPTTLGRE
jgi:hypothetical protein